MRIIAEKRCVRRLSFARPGTSFAASLSGILRMRTSLLVPLLALTVAACGSQSGSSPTSWANPTLPPLPILSLAASPASVTSNGSSTLSWSSTNATSCAASGAWSGSKATSGSQSTGVLTASRSYSLTCTGPGGSASASTTVMVSGMPPPPPVPTVSLAANPTSVANGASSTLTWSSTNATSCTASGAWSGSKATFRQPIYRRAHRERQLLSYLYRVGRQRKRVGDRDRVAPVPTVSLTANPRRSRAADLQRSPGPRPTPPLARLPAHGPAARRLPATNLPARSPRVALTLSPAPGRGAAQARRRRSRCRCPAAPGPTVSLAANPHVGRERRHPQRSPGPRPTPPPALLRAPGRATRRLPAASRPARSPRVATTL